MAHSIFHTCLLCTAVSGAGTELRAQGFIRTYDSPFADDGVGIVVTSTGYAVGARLYTENPSKHMVGAWTMDFAGNNAVMDPMDEVTLNAFAQAIANAPGDAVFVAGSRIAAGDDEHDAFLLRRSANGTIDWLSQPAVAGDEQYFAIEPLTDGGALAAGVRSVGNGHDAWVTRFDANGLVMWSSAIGGATDEEAYAITVQGNDVMLAGRVMNYSGTSDAWAARLDLSGNVVWTSQFGGARNEDARAVEAIGSGVFLFAGRTNTYGMYDTTEARIKDNIRLVAFDLNGDTLWTRVLGDTLYDRRAFAMDVAANGDLFVVGEASPLIGEALSYATRVTSTGVEVWQRMWDLGKEERLLGVRALSDGIISAGWAFSGNSRMVTVIRRNANGD